MIDVRLLRDDPDGVAAALARRGLSRADVDRLVELDAARRDLTARVDTARNEQKVASRAIGGADPADRPRLIEAAAELKAHVAAEEAELAAATAAFEAALVVVPNLPHRDAPPGEEGDGVVLRTVGERPVVEGGPRDHVDLLEGVGIELGRAAKVSGARFVYLRGDTVLLELALVRYALDVAMRHGHEPVVPPVLVREEAMYGTGFLPTDEQQLFRTERDGLYLAGTSEVPLAGLHLDEIVEADDLPLRYAGFSTCFRREAGTYGKDTRGMFRVHQFDKVELFSFVEPSTSDDEHRRLLAIEEEIMGGLELHYQVVDIPVGDLGASAARKFDIEAWLPGQGTFRELTSTSNTTDYQARRLRTRIRRESGTELLHTLNGTACAIGRTIIAVVETHQRPDGSVGVPAALQPYLDGREVLFGRG